MVTIPTSRLACLTPELCSPTNTLTAQHPALCSEPGLATRAGAGSEGSVQGVSCCPLVMGGVEERVMETKGRKYLPIYPVTGHPPRMGTRLPAARVGINS